MDLTYDNADSWLTAQEAAVLCGLSRSHFARFLQSGEIKSIRKIVGLSHIYLIHKSEIDGFKAKRLRLKKDKTK